jgi:fibronectin-binding autotransporter adhesin
MKKGTIARAPKSCFTLVALGALLLVGSANFAAAQKLPPPDLGGPLPPLTDAIYIGATGGMWSVTTNWSGGVVPNAIGDSASYDGVSGGGLSKTVVQDIAAGVTLGSLSLTGSANVGFTLTLTNPITFNQDGAGAGTATISNSNTSATTGNQLFLSGGTLTLADNVLITNTGASTNAIGAIEISSTIAGTGNITFSNVTNDIAQAGSIRIQTGVNTFTGSVLVQKGTVSYNLASSFGGAGNALTLGQAGQGGATLISTAAVTLPNNITVASGSGGTLVLGSVSTAATGGTYSGGITLNGNVSLTSANTGATTGLKFTGAITGIGAITKIGTGSVVFSGAGVNTYSGGTVVNAGVLAVLKDSGLGTGNVDINASGISLILQGGTTNNYISDNATLSLTTGAMANLNFTLGTTDVVGGLVLGGVVQTALGTYGSTASGAMHPFDAFFIGNGTLSLIPEPSTWAMTIVGAGLLLSVQRFRRKKS